MFFLVLRNAKMTNDDDSHGPSPLVQQRSWCSGITSARATPPNKVSAIAKQESASARAFSLSRRIAALCRWVHSSVVRAADCRSAGPWLKSGCALEASHPLATASPPSLHPPPHPPSSRAQQYFARSKRCDEAACAYPLWDSNPQSLD